MATNFWTRDLLAAPFGLCSTGENKSKMEKSGCYSLAVPNHLYNGLLKCFRMMESP